MILSAQTIRELKIVTPFFERSVHDCGMSYGLSSAGYDVRVRQSINLEPGGFVLASTLEYFSMPDDVLAQVADKSTLARIGLAVQNTIIEPKWFGELVLELTNHSKDAIQITAGQPIAQIIFMRLDRPTEQPYNGKYQFQLGITRAIFEGN